jgi:hypothetical protein
MRDEYRKSVKVTMATGKDNKSFDNVWHRDLLKKNKSLWNFLEFVALIENYLSDRNQKVVLHDLFRIAYI